MTDLKCISDNYILHTYTKCHFLLSILSHFNVSIIFNLFLPTSYRKPISFISSLSPLFVSVYSFCAFLYIKISKYIFTYLYVYVIYMYVCLYNYTYIIHICFMLYIFSNFFLIKNVMP